MKMREDELKKRLADADRVRDPPPVHDRMAGAGQSHPGRAFPHLNDPTAVALLAADALRDVPSRVLTIEAFIIFKVLSTRERDLEDAPGALRRASARQRPRTRARAVTG